jgi:CDP-diacylglycerol--serine O-phosphatidyltransferase
MILGAYNLACLVTLFGMVAAVAACMLALGGYIELALVGLVFAGLADLFDGPIARRLERSEYEREFGIQLDTVVDVVAFVVTPFVVIFSTGLHSALGLSIMVLFLLSGAIRLAHFNTMKAQGDALSSHHRGLPVTYTALAFPILYVARDFWPASSFHALLQVALVAFAVLFVIDVPIRKPRGVFYVLFPLLAAVMVIYWTWRFVIRAQPI